jgi:hypothetical protein
MWTVVQRLHTAPDVWKLLESHFEAAGEFSPITFTHLVIKNWRSLGNEQMEKVLTIAIKESLSTSKSFLFIISSDASMRPLKY